MPVGNSSHSVNKGLKFKPKWAKLSWSRDQHCAATAAYAHTPIHIVQHCSCLCSSTAQTQWHLVTTNASKVYSKQQKWSVCNVGSFRMMCNIFAKDLGTRLTLTHSKMNWKIPTFVVPLWKNIWLRPQTYGLTESCFRRVACSQQMLHETGTELNSAHTKMLVLSGHYVLANCY